MKIEGYFIISDKGKARFVQKPPFLKKGEVSVKVELELDDIYFEQYPIKKLVAIENEERDFS